MRCLFLVTSLISIPVFADPSVSSDASRQKEQSGGEKVVRDKKLSVDKSTGNKATATNSRENTAESSIDRKTTEKQGKEQSLKRDYTVQVDINSLLIREFMMRYEAGLQQPAMSSKAGSVLFKFFADCKPFGNILSGYPVAVPGRQPNGELGVAVVTARQAAATTSFYQSDRPFLADATHPVIQDYGVCRLAAHYYMTEAAERVSRSKVVSENDVRSEIESVFNDLEQDEAALQRINNQVWKTWNAAVCGPWLRQANQYNGTPAMQCGTVKIEGEQVFVFGMPTLSKDAIDGKRYQVSIAMGDSDTRSAEKSLERSSKTSVAQKASSSSERYAEIKRDAQFSRTTQAETGSTSRTQRGSQSSVSVNPKSGQ